ncbi:hypothetical protein MD484_g612, partial [Candolleomyces efflorescens]
MGSNTQDARNLTPDEQRRLIRAEIGEPGDIPATKMEDILKQYRNVTTDEELEGYLAKTAFYKNGNWKLPRRKKMNEKQLYGPMRDFIDDIVSEFYHSPDRKTFVSSGKRFYHQESPATNHYSSPNVIIQGKGPSFEYPHRGTERYPSLGYSNTASCIEIKLDTDIGSTMAVHVPQAGIYSSNLIVAIGAQYTDLVNINENPKDFIRLILGWRMGQDGRKETGTLTTEDAAGNEVKYDLVTPHPIFIRRSIRGRGTICWGVRDSKGNEFLVKDSWRSEDRQSETTFLKKTQGLKGVVQMVSCEEDRESTESFRCPVTNAADAAQIFHNRYSMRVVLQCYGPPIIHFTSRKHAISALRDAIAGHRNLALERRILHRDVSIFNILLGNPDWRTGTRLFQSIMALHSFEKVVNPIHDYLDDIESFFYVLCYLMLSFNGDGEHTKAELSSEMRNWDNDDPTLAANRKWMFISWPLLAEDCVLHYWQEPCVSLLKDFKKFVENIVQTKIQIFATEITDEERRTKVENLHGKIDEHYKQVLDLFDKAIEMLPDSDSAGDEATDAISDGCLDRSPHPTPLPTAKASANRVPGRKRSSREIGEPEGPKVKHPRTSRSTRSKRGAAKPSPFS